MPASKAQQATTAKRRAQAIALRLAGMDFDTIAERLGYANRGAASKDVWRAVEAHRLEEAQAVANLREVEGQRLDRLQAAVWAKALKGDVKAIETVLKVITQRAKLFGLDAPVRAEISGPGGHAVQLTSATLAELNDLITLAGDPGDADDEEELRYEETDDSEEQDVP
jgi:Rad3-related DNA helicase